jgi:hypothetical protein
MATKRCKQCGEQKVIDQFYEHVMMRDGRMNTCKGCLKQYRSDNIERVRKNDRLRSTKPARKAHNVANTKAWRAANPDRYKAHNKVAYAIKKGALVKQPCTVCGSDQSHAHHEDYTKPLEVIWLCAIHHKERH